MTHLSPYKNVLSNTFTSKKLKKCIRLLFKILDDESKKTFKEQIQKCQNKDQKIHKLLFFLSQLCKYYPKNYQYNTCIFIVYIYK